MSRRALRTVLMGLALPRGIGQMRLKLAVVWASPLV